MARHDIRDWQALQSKEQLSAVAKQGADASARVRASHRLFKDILKDILSAPLETEDEKFRALKALGIEHPKQEDAVMLAASQKAMSGDIEAVRFLRDTLGEKPTEAFNMNLTGKPVKALDLSGLSDQELEALADQAEG